MRLRLTIAFLFIGLQVFAQSEATYSQYMFNGLAINPAYAGSHGALDMSILGRFQSIGLDGAPETQTFSIHTPVTKKKIGIGLNVTNDKIGVTQQTGFYAAYAYRISFRESTLSLGLQGGGTLVDARYSQLLVRQPGDPVANADVKGFKPNFGAGIYLYSEKYYVGLSMPQIIDAGNEDITIYQPLIFTAGYVFTLNPALKLKPNILFKSIGTDPVEFNYNMNLLIQEALWVGVSYRPNNTMNMIVELQLTEKLRFGYAYDFGINELARVNSGSHEFMLNFLLRKNKMGVVTPRYF